MTKSEHTPVVVSPDFRFGSIQASTSVPVPSATNMEADEPGLTRKVPQVPKPAGTEKAGAVHGRMAASSTPASV
jgi:hypothetical protein